MEKQCTPFQCVQRDRIEDMMGRIEQIEEKLHGKYGDNGLAGRVVRLEQMNGIMRVWVERVVMALLGSAIPLFLTRLLESMR